MNMQISRQGSQIIVRETHEVKESLNINDLHARIDQCKRNEEMYRAKADEWANKRLKYQRVLYEALGEELESAQGGDGEEPQGE